MASLPRVSPISNPDSSSRIEPNLGKHSSQNSSTKSSKENQQPPSTPQTDPPPTTVHHSSDPAENGGSSKPVQSQPPSISRRADTRENMEEPIPGAFPTDAALARMKEEEAKTGPPPSAYEKVKDAAEAVGDYAKEFIPPSLGHYFTKKKKDTLTTEEPSGSNVGVGSLPGSNQEASVALLPDERPPKDDMPSSEQISGSKVGVGSLPGGADESSVAKLPDERNRSTTPMETESPEAPSEPATIHSRTGITPPLTNAPETVTPPDARAGKSETSSPKSGKVTFPGTSASEPGVHPHGRRKGSRDPPGRKEPHTTPYQQPDAIQSAYEQFDVSGEEVEARLQQGVTPKTLKQQELFLSDISDIEEELRHPPSPSDVRSSGYAYEPSVPNARYAGTAVLTHRPYSPIHETSTPTPSNERPHGISGDSGTTASRPVRTPSPEPALARAIPSADEPPKIYPSIHDMGNPTDVETLTMERLTLEPTEGEGGGVAVVDYQTGATVQRVDQPTARTDPPLDMQPVGAVPHEGPKDEALASASTSETAPKKSGSGGKTGRKGREEGHAGEGKPNGSEQKTKSSFMKKLAGVFHHRSGTQRESTSESVSDPLGKSGDRMKTQEEQLQHTVLESSNNGAGSSSPGKKDDAIAVVLSEDKSGQRPSSVPPPGAQNQHGVGVAPPPGWTGETSGRQDTTSVKDLPRARDKAPSRPRAHSHPSSTPRYNPAHLDETLGALPDDVGKKGAGGLPIEKRPGGSRVAVGLSPGPAGEVGVATLPGEMDAIGGQPTPPQAYIDTQSTNTFLPSPLVTGGQEIPQYRIYQQSEYVLQHGQKQGVGYEQLWMCDQQSAGYQHLGVGVGNVGQKPDIAHQSYVQIRHKNDQEDQRPTEDQDHPQTQNLEAQTQRRSTQERVYYIHRDRHHGPEPQQSETALSGTRREGAPVGIGLFEEIELKRGGRVAETAGIAGAGLFSLSQARKDQEERGGEVDTGERRAIFNARASLNTGEAENHDTAATGWKGKGREGEIETGQREVTSNSGENKTQGSALGHESHTKPTESSPISLPRQRSVPLGMESSVIRPSQQQRLPPSDSEVSAQQEERLTPNTSAAPGTRSYFRHNQQNLEPQGTRGVAPITIHATEIQPTQARVDVPVLQDVSIHPSSSSPTENFSPRAQPSTWKQISGKQADLIQPLRDEYVRSVIPESGIVLGTEGTLPGYPTATGLSALIGERMYDDHMRAVGAAEPTQTSINTLTKQPHFGRQSRGGPSSKSADRIEGEVNISPSTSGTRTTTTIETTSPPKVTRRREGVTLASAEHDGPRPVN